jgi:hypothetical protein
VGLPNGGKFRRLNLPRDPSMNDDTYNFDPATQVTDLPTQSGTDKVSTRNSTKNYCSFGYR